MSRELFKMNMIASVQKLDNEDIEIIQNYIETIEQENKQLKEELKSANEEITWWSNRFNAVERDNRQLKEALKDIEELLLSEEQPVQPCNIRYDILEIIKKALGGKEIEEIPLFEGTLEQLNNLSILGDKENE